jgi:hypothetical protein
LFPFPTETNARALPALQVFTLRSVSLDPSVFLSLSLYFVHFVHFVMTVSKPSVERKRASPSKTALEPSDILGGDDTKETTKTPQKRKSTKSNKSFDLFAPSKGQALAGNLLEVKASSIPGAGQGVFTKIDIPKGVRVLEYTGVWKDEKKTDGAHAHNGHRYCYEWSSKTCIDASDKRKGGLGRFVNDVYKSEKKVNLEWHKSSKAKKVFMMSTRNIRKGQELFISYDQPYWAYHEEQEAKRVKREANKAAKAAEHADHAEQVEPVDQQPIDATNGVVPVEDEAPEVAQSEIMVEVSA